MATTKDFTPANDHFRSPFDRESILQLQAASALSKDQIIRENGVAVVTRKDEYGEKSGYIVGLNNGVFGAFIPSCVYYSNTMYPCIIANTVNEGLVYADVDENGETVSLGPIDSLCIIGTVEKPTAVLIPIDNYQAVLDGQKILEGLREEHEALIDEEAACMIDIPCDDEPKVKKNTKVFTPIIWE